MTDRALVIGTRGSRLALAQAALVVEALERAGRPTRISIIETAGDRQAPDTSWGEGAFVSAIERALLAGSVDVAVHSAKDIPTDEDPRLCIGAYLPRADPRDALVVRVDAQGLRLDDLAPGTRVGTDSPRRTGFALARRPDLGVHPLHGNVDTRLRRLDAGETDALILACAGLDRLGLGGRIVERIDPDIVPPAPGQGAIAVQVRRDEEGLLAALRSIDDPDTRLAVEAERAFLAACGGGCRAPIGALGVVTGDSLSLVGGVASPDGSSVALDRRNGPSITGRDLAAGLAQALVARGGQVDAARDGRGDGMRSGAPRVLVTRAADQAAELMAALAARGLDPLLIPSIDVEPVGSRELREARRRIDAFDWVVVTSANGVRAILPTLADAVDPAPGRSVRWAAVGPATAALLERAGMTVSFRPSRSLGLALARELPIEPGDRALVVHGDLAAADLAATLRARGATVEEVVVYRTREAPEASRALLRRAITAGPIDAVVFTSGSTVRGLVALGDAEGVDVRSIPAICLGPETADAARVAGLSVRAVSNEPGIEALAVATARAIRIQPAEVS